MVPHFAFLKSCTHVFICYDAVKKPLQKPYDGPYKVIKCSDKYYTVDVNGHHEVVSIDHLKPVFHEAPPTDQATDQATYPIPDVTTKEDLPLPTKPHSVTHCGHQAHWSKHLSSTFIYSLAEYCSDHMI